MDWQESIQNLYPDKMMRPHYDLWSGSGEGLAHWWTDAINQYDILTREPVTALYH